MIAILYYPPPFLNVLKKSFLKYSLFSLHKIENTQKKKKQKEIKKCICLYITLHT